MTDIISAPVNPSLSLENQDQTFPVGRVFCIGRNYAEHAKEMNASADPIFFMKPGDAVTQSDLIPYPDQTEELHHEVELVLALGEGGHVIASGIGVDLTRRDLQGQMKKKGAPWEIGKSFENSAPTGSLRLGPAPIAGSISLAVNGDTRQSGELSDMILPPQDLLTALSRYFTLKAGDLIFTGTPAGVGPLQRGDKVQAMISGLKTLEFKIS